jgi:hypothetical protein
MKKGMPVPRTENSIPAKIFSPIWKLSSKTHRDEKVT